MSWLLSLLLWISPAQAQCMGFQCPPWAMGAGSNGVIYSGCLLVDGSTTNCLLISGTTTNALLVR
jgi:hypothetical protein